MNRPPHTQNLPEPSVIPQEGWHCSHFYYAFDRAAIQAFSTDQLEAAKAEFVSVLTSTEDGPERLQVSICLLYTSPSPRDRQKTRMPSSA